jgi:hypothetical protein
MGGGVQQNGGARINEVKDFHHVLLFALATPDQAQRWKRP